MPKKKAKDLEDFKRYFTGYQRLFGLTGYKVYFDMKTLPDAFAQIMIDESNHVATVFLSDHECQGRDIRQSAKHEALHLLLHRLEYAGMCRHSTAEDIYQASEELVFKLEELILDKGAVCRTKQTG